MTNLTFITGATSGIGLETARLFAREGRPLVLNGRRLNRLNDLQKELSGQTEVLLAPFDVSDKEEVVNWFQKNAAICARVGALINNAGLARGSDPIQKADEKDWDEMIDTNIKGLLAVTHRLIPALIANKGHIVNLGSVAGRWTYTGGAVYCATKFAVRALSEGFRMDLIGTGVRVTNIEPGMVETEFSDVRFRDAEKAKQVYKGMKPLTPQDIAQSIWWAVNQPQHVNIQELVIFPTDQASLRDVHRI
jgi:NADP-dependent 3-hydroxy acid dehydrogenase YdfG